MKTIFAALGLCKMTTLVLALLILAFVGWLAVRTPRQTAAPAPVQQHPPIWPPRRPDDWGVDLQRAYQDKLRRYQAEARLAQACSVRGGPPMQVLSAQPMPPIIPSWEDHNRQLQSNDPLQIRWAQNEVGTWIQVIWGNSNIRPSSDGPLPVYQAMKRRDTGAWEWVLLGTNVATDWQRGRQTFQDFGPYLRPCGSPGYVDPPAPPTPDGSFGTSQELGDEELRQAGIVEDPPTHRRRRPATPDDFAQRYAGTLDD